MPSHWLAVGPETDPQRHARQLQRSWERLLADGALGLELPPGATAGLRPTIVESWRRSLATGLDPTDTLAPIEADESEVRERWFEHPLGSLSEDLMAQLRKVADESGGIVVVTDDSGLVLHRVGDEWLKERAAEMNLVEGARYSEGADGTNGIGTALAADHAFQVFAFEHFNERHHQWVCSGVPLHDPVSGRVIGVIDLSSLWKQAHPRSLQLVAEAAREMEERLVEVRRDQDTRVRRRYGDLLTRTTDLLATRDGYVLAGTEPSTFRPLEIPEGGGEIALGDGSRAVAEPLGHDEAFLVRRLDTHGATPASGEVLERSERHVRELITEQAALRRVATLVARESAPDHLFAAVAEQVARVFDVPYVRLLRYEPERSVVVGGYSDGEDEPFPIGSRWSLDSPGVMAAIRQTGRPARVEDYEHMSGEIAAAVRGAGMRSAIASPIAVESRLWGAMVILSPRHEPFPADTEARLTDFAELIATAISSAESRVALAALADEQAALRRVATLVARGVGPEPLFQAVADEVQRLFAASNSVILRFEDDDTATTLGTHGGVLVPGARSPIDPDFVMGAIRRTRRAARFDTGDPTNAHLPAVVRETGIRSAVASPIVVESELWGAIGVGSVDRSLPPDTERRLADFTELVATAIANAESRETLAQLADEQAALRRVATLVAQGAQPEVIFSAVGEEIGRLFGSALTLVGRFEHDAPALVAVGTGVGVDAIPLGSRWDLDVLPASGRVYRTGRSVRVDEVDYSATAGPIAAAGQRLGVVSTVASPIFVEGRLWGVVSVSYDKQLPPEAEERLEKFSELIATAIGNAEGSAELAASRRRIVAAADDARRRIERDLHDGIQQRLIALSFRARAMTRKQPAELPGLAGELAEGLKDASDELREISRGIHPAILTEAGLGPALRALARRSPVPADVDVRLDQRLPDTIEAAAYYIASEALTNVAKHARATVVHLTAAHRGEILTLEVRDDGVGGAEPGPGSGILGLTDRAEALGGTISIVSPPHTGTTVTLRLPTAA
jgi:signal transduction histidine kinase/putative methionine-R-sulfoxide reductase with GAF domain